MATLLRLRSSFTLRLECAGCGCDGALAPLFSDEWLGTAVWPAAHALIAYLEEQQSALRLPSLTVIELGSGTGACGLAAAVLGANRVLLTDKISLLPTLAHNIALNPAGRSVESRELTWTTAGLPPDQLPEGADLVLMSDCLNAVYGEEHALALAATLRCLLERGLQAGRVEHRPAPMGLLSQARRGSGQAETVFFAECDRIGLVAALLSTCHLPASVSVQGDVSEGAVGESGRDGSSVEVSLYTVKIRCCG
jgi:hypothetical protein